MICTQVKGMVIMNKLIVTSLVVLAAGFAQAKDEAKQTVKQENPGMVMVPASGKPIVLVDARAKRGFMQKLVADENRVDNKYGPGLPLVCEQGTVPSNTTAYAHALLRKKDKGASVVIVVYNGGDAESGFAVFPEDGIALINADRYANREIRLVKEVWRSIGYIAGAGFSKYELDPMHPVWSAEDLDRIRGTRLVAATIMMLDPFFDSVGIKCARNIPYALACERGIAPAPTNSAQKAVWDEVHAIPTEPIKIEFDPKKDK